MQMNVIAYDALSTEEQDLVNEAITRAQDPYAPYSKFPVGAAILAENPTGDSKVFGGCNVENASYGLTVCAERTAAFTAAVEGYRKFIMVAVVCSNAPGKDGTPCGACRQVLREFGPDATVLVVWDNQRSVVKFTLADLLPLSFGPSSLA
jgi:cytidine deaminase